MTLKDAISIEQDIGSKDISYDFIFTIDTTLYPNVLRYSLTKVKRFLRPGPDETMDYTIEYFAAPDDSVRTIIHEWNVAKKKNLLNDSGLIDPDLPQVVIINAFQRRFDELDSIFTSSLGSPFAKDIKSNFLEATERDDIKWVAKNQLNVYLLMFKRDNNIYRQIRAVTYLK